MNTMSFVKLMYAECTEEKRQPQTLQPAGRRSVGKCLQFLLTQLGKPAPKIWGALSEDVGGRTKGGGHRKKSPLKFFPSSSSSAAAGTKRQRGQKSSRA